LVKEVCVWLGDETINLIQPEASFCKTLADKDWNSWPHAPSFAFNWDSTTVADGIYNMYALAADNAGNESKIKMTGYVKINNTSEGSINSPSEITNCTELQAINDNLNWHYKIMNDIDCSETKSWNGGQGFISIGGHNGFVGVLDGQNYVVSNIYQNQTGVSEHSGFFRSMYGKAINLNLHDVNLICNTTYCGGFTYLNSGTIEKSSITGKLSCRGKCGGFAAQNSGKIIESWADMKIAQGGYSGVIAGQNYGGQVENSYAKGSISGSQAGGIVGLSENNTLTNTYSAVQVNNYSKNGGLIGWMYNGASQVASYWDKELSGLDNMCGTVGTGCDDANGLKTAEMKTQASYVGWDFDNIWAIDPNKNDGYPYLQWQTSFTETDNEAPVITLLGSPTVNVYLNNTYTDAGATVSDNADGNVQLVVSGSVDVTTLGTYMITYNATDKSGNSAIEVSRTVNVINKPSSSSSSGGGGGSTSILRNEPVVTTFQTYDPNTGKTSSGDEKESEEEVEVLGVELDLSGIDNLYGQDKDVVEAVSLSEAEIVFGYNEETEMDEGNLKIYQVLIADKELSDEELMSIAYFIQVGTKTTIRLGAGERAGVINSFLSAYGHLPQTLIDWQDVIKIANGRWPAVLNPEAAAKAQEKFQEIYARTADMNNPNDNAAVSIIAYGLRSANRNMESEKNAINIFTDIFGFDPVSALDWDMVRAIAYSGAIK
jgi:hypothetical protein